MEQLLNKHTVQTTQRVLDEQEECPISSEHVLPEYLSDIAVILKCFAYPHMQSRQWSGDQLLIDGTTIIRVLYMDEERRCVHSLEFAQPFSCSMHCVGSIDNAVEITMTTKYLNCRAVSPRRVEVRGAVVVSARAECSASLDVAAPCEKDGFYVLTDKMSVAVACGMVDKVMTVTDSFEFDHSLPPAEMLLGGECRAIIKECKLLAGKAIIKGNIYIHQLYTDSVEGTQTHCLDFVVPYSQILDVRDAREGMPCKAMVQILSDTERCIVGPDGENTVLEVTAKLLIQLQVYDCVEMDLLRDAYHCRYPLSIQTEECEWRSFLAQRFEETKLPLRLAIPSGQWQEILDVWVTPLDGDCACADGRAVLKGRLQIGVIARDTDGEILCQEYLNDCTLEHTCRGNAAEIRPMVSEIRYRSTEDTLDLQLTLCADISDYNVVHRQMITNVSTHEETPYPTPKVSALLYFAEAGESVWDIARVCHTSPKRVVEENELDNDMVREDVVLVVPIVN